MIAQSQFSEPVQRPAKEPRKAFARPVCLVSLFESGRRGYDAGKRIKGRKRHIAVDTQGSFPAVIVHSAGIQDPVAARAVPMRLFLPFRYHPDRVRGRRLHGHTDQLGQANTRLHDPDGQTHRPASIQGSAQALDRRAHPRLVALVAPPIQRLRTAPCLSRNQDLYPLRSPAATGWQFLNRFQELS